MMKGTKTRTILILSVLLILALTLSMISCSKKGKTNTNEGDTQNAVKNETEIATLGELSHLSPSETKEEEDTNDVTEADTVKETEVETETETEKILPVKSLRFTSYGNGTCAVSGIGSCTDACVVIPERSPDGDIVTAIEEKAFFNNTDIKAIEIPSTVTGIGDMAFGGCTSLVYISVDNNNKTFTEKGGSLYSLDMTRLICYPAACGSASVEIPFSVKSISDMAFYGCDTLRQINYGGSLSDWGKIDIGEMNYGLFTASVSCVESGK